MWSEPSPAILHSIETSAYPEQVWEALTDTALLGHWLADSASGWPAVGGTLSLSWERFNMTLDYKVAEVKVCQKLVLKAPMGTGQQTITFGLRRAGRSTWVELCDAAPPFTPANPHSSSESNWQLSLAALKLYCERYFGRARSNFMVVSKAAFTFAEIVDCYATAPGLSRWLAQEVELWPEGEEVVGQPYRLALEDGQIMSGYVMAITDREAALSWDEIEGFLELKTFSLGPGNQMICLRGSGYGLASEKAQALEERLKPGLVRLLEFLEGC